MTSSYQESAGHCQRFAFFEPEGKYDSVNFGHWKNAEYTVHCCSKHNKTHKKDERITFDRRLHTAGVVPFSIWIIKEQHIYSATVHVSMADILPPTLKIVSGHDVVRDKEGESHLQHYSPCAHGRQPHTDVLVAGHGIYEGGHN